MSERQQWMTPAQAASLLHVHPEALRRQVAEGRLVGVRVKHTPGGNRRYFAQDIVRYAAGDVPPQSMSAALITPSPDLSIAAPPREPSIAAHVHEIPSSPQIDRSFTPTSPGVPLGTYRRRTVRLAAGDNAIVFAGTRSGSTAGVCIPAVLAHEGAVICASVSDDLLTTTIAAKRKAGPVMVFDPAGCLDGHEGLVEEGELIGFDPCSQARDWDSALRLARSIQLFYSDDMHEHLPLASNLMVQMLALALRAAARCGASFSAVRHWLGPGWPDLDKLDDGHLEQGARQAMDMLAALPVEMRSSVYPHLYFWITRLPDVDRRRRMVAAADLVSATSSTYLLTPVAEAEAEAAQLLHGLFVQQVLDHAADLNEVRPPLLVVLDSTSHTCPVPLLDELLSTSGASGTSILTVWQDIAQLKARYRERADAVTNNCRTSMILPNAGQMHELKLRLFGGGVGGANVARGLHFGESWVVQGEDAPLRLALRMWFMDPAPPSLRERLRLLIGA